MERRNFASKIVSLGLFIAHAMEFLKGTLARKMAETI